MKPRKCGKNSWVSCSVSWIPKELEEIKVYTKLKGKSFSSYIRSLLLRDRIRRNREIQKLKAKAALDS